MRACAHATASSATRKSKNSNLEREKKKDSTDAVLRPGISFIQTTKQQTRSLERWRLGRRARRLLAPTRLLPLSGQTGAYDAQSDITEPLSKGSSATDRRFCEDFIFMTPSVGFSGCQARISLINEPLLKFHKSNPITRFPHAPSALMECRNVSFSHSRLEFI